MKKIILSAGVIIVFVLYAIKLKFGDDRPRTIVASTSSSQTQDQATPSVATGSTPPAPINKYKDGTYTGDVTDAFYGNIQVKAIITGGKITDIIFLQYPNDRGTSVQINTQAMPILKTEAIAIQGAKVDNATGATQTSDAFVKSMQSALQQAI